MFFFFFEWIEYHFHDWFIRFMLKLDCFLFLFSFNMINNSNENDSIISLPDGYTK